MASPLFILSSLVLTTCLIQPLSAISCKVTNGTGGEYCGKVQCLKDKENAFCNSITETCECGGTGEGQLVCGSEGYSVCYVMCDPRIVTFSDEGGPLAASCKFTMTRVTTKIKLLFGSDIGECSVQVNAWGAKGSKPGRLGKIYIGGFEVKFIVKIFATGKEYYHATTVFGTGTNGEYKFYELGKDKPGDSYGDPLITNIQPFGSIYTYYDEENNIAEVQSYTCGIKVGYRPAESVASKAKSSMSPGVYVLVRHFNEPDFIPPEGKDEDDALCMAPDNHNKTLKKYMEDLNDKYDKEVTPDLALMFRILTSDIDQEFPGAPEAMEAFVGAAKQCLKKRLLCALQYCSFITKIPKFLKCWGKHSHDEDEGGNQAGGERRKRDLIKHGFLNHGHEGEDEPPEFDNTDFNKSLRLMTNCVKAFCSPSSDECEDVKSTISTTSCAKYIPHDVDSIMTYNCDDLHPDDEPH